MERLTIKTLGGLTIQRDGDFVTGFATRKVMALLVYLVCNPRPHSREVMAEMLWEDHTQAQSLNNLRVTLTSLRKQVGSYVEITRQTVSVKLSSSIYLDTEDFDQRLTAWINSDVSSLEEALDLYQGDFLEGFYIDSQGFEDWALLERERLRLRAVAALDNLITQQMEQGDYIGALVRATRLLQIDPLREETHRTLMDLYTRSGQRNRALAQYEILRGLLADELGVEPLPNTVALAQQIRSGELALHTGATRIQQYVPGPEQSSTITTPVTHHLPAQSTSFVGRDAEIA